METNGIFYGATGNGWIKPRIQWSAVANTEGNYSDVTATLSYTRTNYGYTTYGYWAGSLTINADCKSASGVYTEITEAGYRDIITHTVRVYHDDDGTKTVTISATGSIGGTTLTYTDISAEVKLAEIPRAAAISATDADIGAVSTVSIKRTSAQYTHTVSYRFGACTGYLSENGLSDTAVKLTQISLPFVLPESFYYEIPDAPIGVCTLTCTTYLEDAVVGTPQQTTFTVRANPEKCAPLLTARAVDTNPVTIALTGNADHAVRYSSQMVCTLHCQGRFGATIVEKWIAGTAVSEDSLVLSGYDAEGIRFIARDSRGYVSEDVITPTLISYAPPTGLLSANRSDATSGNATLTVRGSFFSGSFGAQNNALQLRYRIGDGNWVSLPPEITDSDYRATAPLTGLTYTSAHRIELEVSDAVSTLMLSTTVSPGVPVFDWGREDFRFRVPVTAPKVTGLSEPIASADAANKAYTDTKLALTGGSMSGELDMAGHILHGLPEPAEETDAVNKAYADTKRSWKRLWQNASPNSSFQGQTVSLPLSRYNMVQILFFDKCDNHSVNAWWIPMEHEAILTHITSPDRDTSWLCTRPISVTADGIVFGNTILKGFDAVAGWEDNWWVIPYEIYGLKGESV